MKGEWLETIKTPDHPHYNSCGGKNIFNNCIHQLTVLTAAVFPLRVAGAAAGGGGRRRRRPAGRGALCLVQ